MKNLKKCLIAILCCCSISFNIGCSGVEKLPQNPIAGKDYVVSEKLTPEKVNAWTYKSFNGAMPIAGFIGPTAGYPYEGNWIPSRINEESYQTIEDCGLNIIYGHKEDYEYSSSDVVSSLKLAEAHNMKYLFYDTKILNIAHANLAASADVIKERIKLYKDYTSFGGLIGMDEPRKDKFALIKTAQENFKQATTGLDTMLYTNLFPIQVFGATYEDYLTEYMKTSPTTLSYDMYPFEGEKDAIHASYFANLDIARSVASNSGTPFWVYIQGGGEWENLPIRCPTEGEMLWNINTSLCYGAKGIQYFPYYQPPEFAQYNDDSAALVNMDGKKNATWYYAQKANKQIKAIDDVLMQSANKGIIINGESPISATGSALISGKSFRQLKDVSGDNAIIGCFDYLGGTALYVVNNSTLKDKAKVNLKFNKKYMYDVTQRATSRATIGKELSLTLAPGEGALVVLR